MAAPPRLRRRWALRILWELRDRPLGARALLDRCGGLSSSVLYDRLRQLVEAGLIDKDDQGSYRLTGIGARLRDALAPLDEWSRSWASSTRSARSRTTP